MGKKDIRLKNNVREKEIMRENVGHIKDEIMNSLKKMEGGKSSGKDAIQVEMFKKSW